MHLYSSTLIMDSDRIGDLQKWQKLKEKIHRIQDGL
jgi:hypothetical protein